MIFRSGGIKRVYHAAFLHPLITPGGDKRNRPFSKFENKRIYDNTVSYSLYPSIAYYFKH
jgi:hypothetical protein